MNKLLAALLAKHPLDALQDPGTAIQNDTPEFTPNPMSFTPSAPPVKEPMPSFGDRARNLLGVLGDAFLVQSGNKPVYQPYQDEQAQSKALSGFPDDPINAIKRLNDAGYPAQAQELFKTYATQQATTQAKQSQAALDAARLENERAKGFGIIGSMASPRTLNEKTWDAMIPIIMAKAQRSGIADLIPPPPKSWAEGGQAWAEALQRQGIDPYKQERLGQIDEGLGVQHQNANTRERALNAQTILGGGRLIQSGMENTNRAMTPEEIAQFPGATSGTVTAGGKFNPHYPGGKSAKSFGSGGGAKTPSKPPRFANDHYRIGSQMFTSKDGKTWVPQ